MVKTSQILKLAALYKAAAMLSLASEEAGAALSSLQNVLTNQNDIIDLYQGFADVVYGDASEAESKLKELERVYNRVLRENANSEHYDIIQNRLGYFMNEVRREAASKSADDIFSQDYFSEFEEFEPEDEDERSEVEKHFEEQVEESAEQSGVDPASEMFGSGTLRDLEKQKVQARERKSKFLTLKRDKLIKEFMEEGLSKEEAIQKTKQEMEATKRKSSDSDRITSWIDAGWISEDDKNKYNSNITYVRKNSIKKALMNQGLTPEQADDKIKEEIRSRVRDRILLQNDKSDPELIKRQEIKKYLESFSKRKEKSQSPEALKKALQRKRKKIKDMYLKKLIDEGMSETEAKQRVRFLKPKEVDAIGEQMSGEPPSPPPPPPSPMPEESRVENKPSVVRRRKAV